MEEIGEHNGSSFATTSGEAFGATVVSCRDETRTSTSTILTRYNNTGRWEGLRASRRGYLPYIGCSFLLQFLTFGVNDDSCPIDLDRWRKEQNSSVEDVSRLDSNLEPLDEAFESLEDAGEEKDPSSSVVTSAPPSETEEEAKNEAGVAVGKKLRRGHRHRGSLQRLQSRMKMEDRDVADITRSDPKTITVMTRLLCCLAGL